jgi:hypothetical protein
MRTQLGVTTILVSVLLAMPPRVYGQHTPKPATHDGMAARAIASVASSSSVKGAAPTRPVLEEMAPDPPASPFYTRWWFYVMIGVASVGAGLAIGYAVGRESRPSTGVPLGKPVFVW